MNPFCKFVQLFRPTRFDTCPPPPVDLDESPLGLEPDPRVAALNELQEKVARCLCYHNPGSPSWADIDEEVREEYRSMAFGVMFKLKDFQG